MNTKENVREQLQEKTIQEMFEIMNQFFRTDSFSWQAGVLYDIVTESDEACVKFYEVVIDKIIAEVSVEDLVEHGWIEHPLQDIIDEFKELKSQIEAMTYNEVFDTYCTLGESDGEFELDVSDDIGRIVAVYIDIVLDGSVVVDVDHITVRGEDGQNEVVYLSKIIKE